MKISFSLTAKVKNFPKELDQSLLIIPFDAEKAVISPTGHADLDKLCLAAIQHQPKPIKVKSQISLFHQEAGRVVLLATNKADSRLDWQRLGHDAFSCISKATSCRILLGEHSASDIAEFCLGLHLSSYSFRPYWNKKNDDQPTEIENIDILCNDPDSSQAAAEHRAHLAAGVAFGRDLISEPPNVLYPETFAARLEELSDLGVKVTVLDEDAMDKLGMHALLGVGQGSIRPSRLVSMHWDNNPDHAQPTAIVGKGVTFDTGGISLKPAANMEEMKFDMGGAGVVSGLMKALALQNAPMNVVGVVGLAENMPDGNAQRPGDVVTAMDGQTIAIHNTDAEGRLVLADALHYTNVTFQPTAMVNLATLTGAIIIALGSEHAGLFSNDDDISNSLTAAGLEVEEKLWRMPLHKSYDKQLNTLVADMCNIGGREGGSITAAQFLQRFVKDTPWAHLDIAGVTWNNKTKPNAPEGASGFGVQLLHRWLEQRFGC